MNSIDKSLTKDVSNIPPKVPFLGDLGIGLMSPIYSLRFFQNNKSLLFIGLAPQVLGLVLYVWLVINKVLPYLRNLITNELPASWQTGILLNFTSFILILLLVTAYGLLFVPLVSAISSPIYDFIAAKTFEKSTGEKLPNQGFRQMISSIITEVVKLSGYFGLLALSFFVPVLAPFFFLFSIWYLGWDHLDRTLLLMNKSFFERVGFGIKHVLACLSLGAWSYIPLLGGLFGFTFASAGAIAVARLTAKSRGKT